MAVRKDEVNLQITIGAQQAGKTLREMKAEARDIRRALERIPVGTAEFDTAKKKLDEVTGKIAEAEGRTKKLTEATGFWQRALSTAVGVFGGLNFQNILQSAQQYIGKLFDIGVGLDSLQNKTRTVFEDSTEVVQGFAEQNAQSLGLAKNEYVELATNTGDLLKPMGFAADAVANLSSQLTNQAGVFPEWTNGKVTTQQASEILTKALLGERDALNTLGIDIKQSLVDEELKRKGLDGLTGASRRQAEALITLEQITKQSASANEAFAKNSDSSARKMAEIRAKVAEVSQTLATVLIPVFNAAISAGLRLITWAIQFGKAMASIPAFINENKTAIGALVVALVSLNAQGIAAAANSIRMAVAQRAATIATTAQAAAQRVLNFVLAANPIGLVVSALALLAGAFVTAYQRSETFRRIVGGVFQSVTDQVKGVIGFFADLGSGLANIFSGNFSDAVSNFQNAFQRINPFEIGKSIATSFTAGYNAVEKPKADVKPDVPAAQDAGKKTGEAFTDTLNKELDRLGDSGEQGVDKLAKAAKQALDLRLKEIETAFLKEELVTDRALFNKEISEGDHGKRILELKQTQYQQELESFKRFHQEESKEALEAQKKLLEIQQQLSRPGIAPLAQLGTKGPAPVTSQSAQGLKNADVSAANDEIKVLQDKFGRIVDAEQGNELLRLEMQRNSLNARLEFLREAGLQETAVFQETLGAKLKADEDYQQAKLDNEQRSADLKRRIEEASYQATADFFGLAIDLLSADEAARKRNAGAIKAFQTAQVTVQGIAEVQKIWAGAAELGPIVGPIIGAIQTAVAVGRTALAIGKIQAAKFARGAAINFGMARMGIFGGRPHSSGGTKGFFEDGTVLEVERDEAFAVVNKRNAPLLRALSAINSYGGHGVPFFARGGVPAFAAGGLPTVSTTPAVNLSPQAAAAPLLNNMGSFTDAVSKFEALVQNFPREVKSRVVYTELESTASDVETARDDAAF